MRNIRYDRVVLPWKIVEVIQRKITQFMACEFNFNVYILSDFNLNGKLGN